MPGSSLGENVGVGAGSCGAEGVEGLGSLFGVVGATGASGPQNTGPPLFPAGAIGNALVNIFSPPRLSHYSFGLSITSSALLLKPAS